MSMPTGYPQNSSAAHIAPAAHGEAPLGPDGYPVPFGQEGDQPWSGDYELADVAPARTAEEIETPREFEPKIEPGDYLLELVGFKSAPRPEEKLLWLNGVSRTIEASSVVPIFRVVDHPDVELQDWILLPPPKPEDQAFYLNGTKDKGKGQKGFHAEKYAQLVSRLGWPYPKGGRLPAEARNLKNWLGRRVVGTVELQDSNKPNPRTGKPYQNLGIRLYSFRSAEGFVPGQPAPSSDPRAAQPAVGGRPAPAPQRQAAAVGLEDL